MSLSARISREQEKSLEIKKATATQNCRGSWRKQEKASRGSGFKNKQTNKNI